MCTHTEVTDREDKKGENSKRLEIEEKSQNMQRFFERGWKIIQPEMEERLRRRWCRPPVNPEPLQMLLCPPPLELWTQTHLVTPVCTL